MPGVQSDRSLIPGQMPRRPHTGVTLSLYTNQPIVLSLFRNYSDLYAIELYEQP